MPTTTDRRYRLRHPLPVAWREPGVLQLGSDPDGVVLEGVPPALAEVVGALSKPRTVTDLRRLAPALPQPWLGHLLSWLDDAGMLVPDGHPRSQIGVIGSGLLAEGVAALLSGCAEFEVLRFADANPRPVAQRPCGAPLTPVLHWDLMAPRWPSLLVVATDTMEPDRALTDALVRVRRCHLVVRMEAARAVVGPLVDPGATPCVRCTDLLRSACDPAWPRLLPQYCRASQQPDPILLAWATATAALQLRGWLAGVVPDVTARSLEYGDPYHTLACREWQPHPDCWCAGLAAHDEFG